jgi:signal transduction histidine kinase/DNA-binding response OmpR family regulator/ligand-binding sensor domain-containing protein
VPDKSTSAVGRVTALGVLVASLALATPAVARTPTAYSVVQWGTDEGLPASSVYDIRQTADGYLWLATTAGLVRFDGRRMRVYDEENSPLENFRLFALHVTATGQLWTIAEDGSVMSGGTAGFASLMPPQARVRYAAEDHEGRTWLMRSEWITGGIAANHLVRNAKGDEFETGQFARPRSRFYLGSHGDLWVRLFTGEPARLEGESFVPHGEPADFVPLVTRPSRGDILFTRIRGARTEVVDLDGAVLATFENGPDRVPWLVDRRDVLWVTEAATVLAYRPGGSRPFWSRELAPAVTVQTLAEDTEGNVWIGTTTDGLFRVSPVPFRVYGREQGIRESEVYRVLGAPDGVLYATTDSGVYRLADGTAHSMTTPDRTTAPLAVLRDSHGTLWTRSGSRLIGQPNRGDRLVIETAGHDLGRLFEDPDRSGILWFRDTVHLLRIDAYSTPGPRITDTYVVPRSAEVTIRQVLLDSSGTVWMVADSGIVRIRDGTVRHFTTADGLPTDRIRTVHEDRDGTLWFGSYGYGIIRYRDGRFRTLRTEHGLGENVVTSILEDASGNFWMSGNRGVYRTSREELDAVLAGRQTRVHSVRYGRPAGLANPETSGYPGIEDRDGRLWFPTFGGLAMVEPLGALEVETPPSAMHIEEITDSRRNWPIDNGVVAVAPGPRRLEIRYTAIALRDPGSVQFRYRLLGLDRDWVEAGASRTATYTRVPPGRYTFHVQAISAGTDWGDLEDSMVLVVAPAWYQTFWFYALSGIVIAIAIVATYRMRIGQLTRRSRRLEALVAQRTAELAQERDTVVRQVEQLQELEHAKSRFFANISHEFRTPLTLIQGPLEDLRAGLHGPLSSAEAGEQVEIALRNSRRLLGLVNQLLAIARAESGRLKLRARPADFLAFIRRLVEALRPIARRKNIELNVSAPEQLPHMFFDPEHMERIFTNLVGNATKFTPAGGHVTVDIRSNKQDDTGEWLVVEVRDDGPGIPTADLERIFERFYRRAHPGGGYQPGTGIGLALARELVLLHHGTIDVDSTEGQGSTFTVRLPVGRAHLDDTEIVPREEAEFLSLVDEQFELDAADPLEAEIQIDPAERAEIAAARVSGPAAEDETTLLVVDDHPEVRAYLRRHLQASYRILEASNGSAGVDLARESLPDLIVSDVMMPIMNGFELCRTLKDDPRTDFIPILLLTAKASAEGRIAGLEERADDYITKPFRIRELSARVKNLIEGRRHLKARFDSGKHRSLSLTFTAPSTTLTTPDEAFLTRLREAIEAHLGDEEFGVEELAREIGQSRATLYRKLKELDAPSPVDLIRKIRLEHAARLLAEGAGSVSEVAYAVGFRSVAHFSTRFKDYHGSTPSGFRQTHRGGD